MAVTLFAAPVARPVPIPVAVQQELRFDRNVDSWDRRAHHVVGVALGAAVAATGVHRMRVRKRRLHRLVAAALYDVRTVEGDSEEDPEKVEEISLERQFKDILREVMRPQIWEELKVTYADEVWDELKVSKRAVVKDEMMEEMEKKLRAELEAEVRAEELAAERGEPMPQNSQEFEDDEEEYEDDDEEEEDEEDEEDFEDEEEVADSAIREAQNRNEIALVYAKFPDLTTGLKDDVKRALRDELRRALKFDVRQELADEFEDSVKDFLHEDADLRDEAEFELREDLKEEVRNDLRWSGKL
eukprot:TRINITY_DN6012_c0_g3_i3.p1 TRINITY_DN6012_c0_g3~~TRINITY_DN6012_c0_g3_i3.p1  ORF type:complete len:312 (-),score=84.65 TRINITY_DN6012_c0_g3_i3:184-1083(-)